MTATVADRLRGPGRRDRLFDVGDERSLDEVVATSWGSLALRGSARCLVCGTTMTRQHDADGPQAAECPSCGSLLE
jgi:hypothetical protein